METVRQTLIFLAILGGLLYFIWLIERNSRFYECEREAVDLYKRGRPAADSLRNAIADSRGYVDGIANEIIAERRSRERALLDSLHSAEQDADVLYGLIEYDMGTCQRR